VQYAVGPGLSVGLEYLLTLYNTQGHDSRLTGSNIFVTSCCGTFNNGILVNSMMPLSFTTQTVRLIMNYKFD
jgi:hypothetical protein